MLITGHAYTVRVYLPSDMNMRPAVDDLFFLPIEQCLKFLVLKLFYILDN